MADPVTTIQHASDTISALSAFVETLTGFITTLVAFCAMVAAIAPKPDPESKAYPVLSVLHKAVNYVGFNVGKAKNKDV
jgi:hypothetical protein